MTVIDLNSFKFICVLTNLARFILILAIFLSSLYFSTDFQTVEYLNYLKIMKVQTIIIFWSSDCLFLLLSRH